MSRTLLQGVLGLAVATTVVAQESPPPAPIESIEETMHGERVVDPYRWLEDLTDPRTTAWTRVQDDYARAFTARHPARDEIAAMMARVAGVDRMMASIVAGDRAFTIRFPASGGPPGSSPGAVLLVHDPVPDAPVEVLIDPAREGEPADASLARALPSPDGRHVLYGIARGGSLWESLRIRDVRTGHDLSDRLVGVHGGRSAVTWAPDGSGFYYERLPVPEAGVEQSAALTDERLYFHRLGTTQDADPMVYGDGPSDWRLTHFLTEDGSYLVVGRTDPSTQYGTLSFLDLESGALEFEPIVPRPDATYAVAGNDGPVLWVYTDLAAPRGRVVAIDLRRPERSAWRELVPEMEETISSWVLARGIGGHLIVGYLRDALNVVRVFDPSGRFLHEVQLPGLGSIWSGFVGRQDSPYATYVLSGLVDPGSVYRLDVRTGRSERILRPDLPIDPDRFVTEQVFVTSRDGTRVPMFVVRRRDAALPAPAWMYGYGFGGWPAAPYFQPSMAVWLERGGVWALPNTRGGGEYGEEWHRAGSGLRKQNAIDDFIAATAWLVDNGITTPRLMVANGSSAGGAVAGAAIIQRPDLYAAAILDYPVLDMLRYHLFTTAGGWASEYGTADDPEAFRVLMAYSPYHTIEPGRCYPATLVSPGENDETTPPHHAYKFVAALQAAQACGAPVLLRVSWGAGHSSGADLGSSIETWTDQLVFLDRVLSPASAAEPGAR